MLYFCSIVFRNLPAYAMGCHPLSYFWSKQAPNPSLLALQSTLVSRFVSKWLFSVICLIAFFIWLNDFVCSSFQSSLLFFILSLCESNGRSGADICDRLGMNFFRWCILPISYLRCFSVFGGSNFMIDSVFRVFDTISSGFILYPNHVISLTANSHLCRFIARFSLSNRASTLFSSVSWFVSDPFVIIIISSRNACAQFMFASLKSMIFWNVAGISVSP